MALSPKKYRANLAALTKQVEESQYVEDDGVDLSKHPSGIVPEILNMAASVDLPQALDILELADKDPSTVKEVFDSHFKCGMIRIPKPRSTSLLFPDGKLIVSGTPDEKELKSVAKKCNRRICKVVDAEKTFKDFRVLVVIAQSDCRFKVKIDELAQDHEDFIDREMQLENAILYQVLDPRVKMVIWESGKVLMVGSKAKENIYKAWELMYPVLLTYKYVPEFHSNAMDDD